MLDKSQINYEIHDNGMLAIVLPLKEWRHYLEDAAHPINVFTYHKNI
jgi:hypothetical protein